MKNNKLDFNMDLLEEESKEEVKLVELDLNKMRAKIPTFTSEKLSEMIVVERYIGFHPDVSVMAMEELARRREEGDPFPFEDYIQKSFNSLPQLNFNLLDLRSVLLNAINTNKK